MKNLWNILLSVVSLILLISAGIHRSLLDLDDPTKYTQSFLVPIEMFSMLLLFLLFVLTILILAMELFQKKFKPALIHFGFLIASIAILILSMYIDAPTLIFMT